MFKIECAIGDERLIPMGEMEPYDIGIIVSPRYPSYDGLIVMRTASLDKEEVMSLSKQQPDFCWSSFDRVKDLQVRLLPPGTELKITIK